MHVPRFFSFFFLQKIVSQKFPQNYDVLNSLGFLYFYLHNSHFNLFCIFSLSSVFNMSLWQTIPTYLTLNKLFHLIPFYSFTICDKKRGIVHCQGASNPNYGIVVFNFDVCGLLTSLLY